MLLLSAKRVDMVDMPPIFLTGSLARTVYEHIVLVQWLTVIAVVLMNYSCAARKLVPMRLVIPKFS